MPKTQVRPSRDLRNHYADIVNSLKMHDHIIITNNGVGESVLINYGDYAKYADNRLKSRLNTQTSHLDKSHRTMKNQ